MARGALTALQAALAGLSGGASGYAQYQREQAEERRRTQEAERQALRDALSKEEFSLKEKEFQARFGPEAVARAEREAAKNREAELERTRISSASAANIERMRQAEEARQSRLGGQAFFEQARQAGGGIGTQLIGNAIANEVARRGRQLTQDEISDLSAAVMGNLMGERRMAATEYAAGMPTREEMGGAGAGAGSSLAMRRGPTQEERARAWMQVNPRMSGESSADYAARMRAAVGG
jgi:hypothetical protein